MLNTVSNGSARPPMVTLVAASVLALAYLAAAWFMMDAFALRNPNEQVSYERAAGIFAGIQSIGFAAIGALLGVAVQQPRVAEGLKARQAIKDVIAPTNDLGGGQALPSPIINRLKEGL